MCTFTDVDILMDTNSKRADGTFENRIFQKDTKFIHSNWPELERPDRGEAPLTAPHGRSIPTVVDLEDPADCGDA